MANIMLIYPEPEQIKDWRFGFSLNLLYVSSILKRAGHQVVFKDYSVEKMDQDSLQQLLKTTDAVIIEFDSFPLKRSLNIHNGEWLAGFIKEYRTNIKTIAIGNDCILCPRPIPNIDYVFKMDAENAINYVVQCLLNGVEIDADHLSRMTLDRLDDLPSPDRKILTRYAEHGGAIRRTANLAKSTLIQTSRGCMNTCRFCQRRGWTDTYREHSIDHVVSEFKDVARNGYINVWICDDNFTFNLQRAKKILERLVNEKVTEGMHIALSSWTNIDLEFLDLAKQANVSVISMGIESVSHDILDFYMKKIDLDKTQELINYADQIGLYTIGNFIIGAPMETEKTIDDSFDYIMNVPFDQVNIKVLDYMLGAELYNMIPDHLKTRERHVFACKENGLNDFSLDYLRMRIAEFHEQFALQRKNHFLAKVKKYGFPYEIVKTDL